MNVKDVIKGLDENSKLLLDSAQKMKAVSKLHLETAHHAVFLAEACIQAAAWLRQVADVKCTFVTPPEGK